MVDQKTCVSKWGRHILCEKESTYQGYLAQE